MVVESKHVFIYGNFLNQEERSRRLPMPIEAYSSAIEVLREFSATELVGKVYIRTPGGNLRAVSPMGVRTYAWYLEYERFLRNGRPADQALFFEAQNGDYWEVLYFRSESDESGGYIAVALKLEGSFWLRGTEFRVEVVDPDKVVAFVPTDSEGKKRTGVTVRVHDERAAKIAGSWLPTDRVFFYEFVHGRTVEGGYLNERTQERIPIT